MTRTILAQTALLVSLLTTSLAAMSAAPDKVWAGPSFEGESASTEIAAGAKSLANGLVIDGSMSFNHPAGSSTVNISVARIGNDSSSRISGTLRLELWATASRPSRGGSISGYRLAVGPNLTALQPQFQYTNVSQNPPYSAPPDGTYWVTIILAEFDSANCLQADSFCLSDSATFSTQTTFGNALPPPPQLTSGATASSLGSRGTVSSGTPIFGGFALLTQSTVLILVRGNSLGTLGVTQGYLDAPRVRLYNGQGVDLVNQGGLPGFNSCLASNTVTDYPVVYYYSVIRQQPVEPRDSCYAATLPAGVYTFSVSPSIAGVTSNNATSTPSTGEILFEVSLFR